MARIETMPLGKDDFVGSHRLVFWLSAGFGALAGLAADAGMSTAGAQGKLDARYVASLAGIPVGRGAWAVDIADDQFTAAASGMTAGILRVFTSGQGTSAARGTIVNGQFQPTAFASSIVGDKKIDDVRMALSSGIVKDYAVQPPVQPDPNRIPLTDEHRKGVLDPMTAALMRVSGTGDPVGPEACQRVIPIFDGRIRYDLQMTFKRTEKVKAEKGYEGLVAVCAVYFAPIAGFDPGRSAIQYLEEQRDMEIWLAPIAGTRVVVPYRVQIPTPIGGALLEATQFVTTPMRTSASTKIQ
jgi:hypothetical protein